MLVPLDKPFEGIDLGGQTIGVAATACARDRTSLSGTKRGEADLPAIEEHRVAHFLSSRSSSGSLSSLCPDVAIDEPMRPVHFGHR